MSDEVKHNGKPETTTEQESAAEGAVTDLPAGPGTVVSFWYDLYDGSAEKVESHRNGEPVLYLFGEPSMLVALQDVFLGKRAGEDFSVTIPHGKAYGRRYPDRTRRLSRKQFEGGKAHRFRVGEIVNVREQGGHRPATVVKVGKFHIDVDLNHRLAGMDLTFDVSIVSVREASADEVAHGHAHGPGGHQH